jgi:signal transduction histidine kinase
MRVLGVYFMLAAAGLAGALNFLPQYAGLKQSTNQYTSTELISRADSLTMHGELRKARTLLSNALEQAKALNNDSLVIRLQLNLATNLIDSDQPDSASVLLNNILAGSASSIDSTRALNLLGATLRYKGEFEQALEKHKAARARVDSASQPALYSKIKLNMAMVQSSRADFGIAFKNYLSGIQFAEAAGDSALLASGLNSLGVAYNNTKQPDKAISRLKRAIEINKKINDRVGLLRATNNLAISYQGMGEFEKSIALYEQALTLQNEVRKNVPPFRIQYNLGQLYKQIDELDKAEDYYKKSLAYCQQAGIYPGLIYNYGGLANVAELRKNFGQARENYMRALEVARQIGAGGLKKEALNSLYQLEKETDNMDQALSYYEQYVALNDSLNEVAREQEFSKTKTRFNLRQEEETNRLLQDKQKQQQARITTQNWLIAASIAIILIILLSLGYVYRSNKQRKEINAQLAAQRNELEEINAVKDKMMAIIAHDLRSPLSAMQGVIYLIKEGELSDKEMQDMANELDLSINQNISMMDNLLVWAQSQMEGLALNTKAIHVQKVVEKVFQNHMLQAQQKGIQLIDEVDDQHAVHADYNLLELILRNLITNSIKFCNAGDKITVSTHEKAAMICFSVQDTGIGIPEDIQRQIFAVNAHSRRGTDDEKGSGLGLKLCKEFVERQNGKMSVQSVAGEGTTMQFSLPKA